MTGQCQDDGHHTSSLGDAARDGSTAKTDGFTGEGTSSTASGKEDHHKQAETQQAYIPEEMEAYQKQVEDLVTPLSSATGSFTATYPAASIPSLRSLDPSAELYGMTTVSGSTPLSGPTPFTRLAQVFLTNQMTDNYKLLCTMAEQQTPSKEVNALTIPDPVKFMKENFDPKQFNVRECFNFWSEMKWKPCG